MVIRPQSDGCACVQRLRPRNWMALATTSNGQARASGRRVEPKGGINTAAYGHAISLGAFRTALGVGVDEAGSVSWRSCSCTRRLVDLATWRLGGLSGRQLTGPVAGAPEVDLRSSAASRHQAEVGV